METPESLTNDFGFLKQLKQNWNFYELINYDRKKNVHKISTNHAVAFSSTPNAVCLDDCLAHAVDALGRLLHEARLGILAAADIFQSIEVLRNQYKLHDVRVVDIRLGGGKIAGGLLKSLDDRVTLSSNTITLQLPVIF